MSEGFHWKAKKDRRGWWLLGTYIYFCYVGPLALMVLFSWVDPEVIIPLILMFIPSTTMLLMIKKGLLKKPFRGRHVARIFFVIVSIFFAGPILIIILLYIPAYYNYFFK